MAVSPMTETITNSVKIMHMSIDAQICDLSIFLYLNLFVLYGTDSECEPANESLAVLRNLNKHL